MASFPTIDYFISSSYYNSDVGFLKPSRFETVWTFPREGIPNAPANMGKKLADNIDSIETPGISISASEGPLRNKFGEREIGGTISATFFESGNLELKDFFWNWIEMIQSNTSDTSNYTRKYFSEVVGGLIVYPILNTVSGEDIPDNRNKKEVFGELFPVSVNSYAFGIAQENEVLKTSVSFKYRKYEIMLKSATTASTNNGAT